jgi:hypothetical protein
MIQRIFHVGRNYAASYIDADVRPNWLLLLPLIFAGDVIVATFVWIVVGWR